jgi:hypothetical protein
MFQLFDGRRVYRVFSIPAARHLLFESLADAVDVSLNGRYEFTYFPPSAHYMELTGPFWGE